MENGLPTFGESYLVSKLKFYPPIVVDPQLHWAKYNTFDSRLRTTHVRIVHFVLNSEGVSALIDKKSTLGQLFPIDIEICERWLIHLAKRLQRARPDQLTDKWIEEQISDSADVQVSPDIKHESTQ